MLVKIGRAAVMLGVTPQTLRAWEATGELVPDRRSAGGVRYYNVGKIMRPGGDEDLQTMAYAHISGPGQEAGLTRQEELLEAFCAAKGWRHEILSDSGSGPNSNKKGLRRFIELILQERVRRLVVTRKDQLSGFGSELIFTLCELRNVEVVAINERSANPQNRKAKS
jgi:predicted site-specific integrase-resolvase